MSDRPPIARGTRKYTLVGYFLHSDQPFVEHVESPSQPREVAEAFVAADPNRVVVEVVPGHVFGLLKTMTTINAGAGF